MKNMTEIPKRNYQRIKILNISLFTSKQTRMAVSFNKE